MLHGRGTSADSTGHTRYDQGREGNWVLVYDNSLDNQHKAIGKFVRRWFGSYVVKRANDNATYHLVELDGTRIAIQVTRKRVNTLKKRHEVEPELEIRGEDNELEELDHDREVDRSEVEE